MPRAVHGWTVAMVVALSSAATGAFAASPAQGQWQFTFSGQDSGHGAATVDAAGSIIGTGHSDTFGYDLTTGGTVAPDGTMTMTAAPAGMGPHGSTSTGAVFNGRAQGDQASGTWVNASAQMNGAWTGKRTAQGGTGGGSGSHCTIAGMEFDAEQPLLYADAMVSPKDGNTRFRVILGNAAAGQGSPRMQIEGMTDHVTGPGPYDMSTAPTWKSSATIAGKKVYVDHGSMNLTAFERQNGGLVKGNLSFSAGGNKGQCSFSLPMQYVDIKRMTG